MLQQQYNRYTSEDFDVWKTLFERQMPRLRQVASDAYLDGIEKINFSAEKIPNFEETNQRLSELTGWTLAVVPGIVPNEVFFRLLKNKQFPATTWLRKMSQLDYLEEPDMFHDVFGHVPLLTNTAFTEYLHAVSDLALDYLDDPHAVEILGRVYWFTVEFGLIRERSQLKIYGAGILSSGGETPYALSEIPSHLPFDIAHIMASSYRQDVFQEKYFVIDSYEQLYDSIGQMKNTLKQMLRASAISS